jgi:hypothetical protein
MPEVPTIAELAPPEKEHANCLYTRRKNIGGAIVLPRVPSDRVRKFPRRACRDDGGTRSSCRRDRPAIGLTRGEEMIGSLARCEIRFDEIYHKIVLRRVAGIKSRSEVRDRSQNPLFIGILILN